MLRKLQDLQFRLTNVDESLLLPTEKNDVVVFIQCMVMYKYGMYAKVEKTIQRYMKKNPSSVSSFGLQSLLAESVYAQKKTEDAIVILQKCNPQSFEQKEVLKGASLY